MNFCDVGESAQIFKLTHTNSKPGTTVSRSYKYLSRVGIESTTRS